MSCDTPVGGANTPLYHERQRLQRCAVHALNNLLQAPGRFSASDLDAIARSLHTGLSLLNPHRTPFLGNWDVNVLEVALRQAGLELRWHDQRDAAFASLETEEGLGLMVNVKSGGGAWGRLLGSGRHWVSLLRLGGEGAEGAWWNLDSKLGAPLRLGGRAELLEYLGSQDDLQAFVITRSSTATTTARPGD